MLRSILHSWPWNRLGTVLLGAAAALSACTDTGDAVGSPEPHGVDPPAPADVDAVVYLIGDAGAAEEGKSPLLVALAEDVEKTAAALPDSSVLVVYLGDNVYEQGVRDPGASGYARDTLRLNTQVRVVAGVEAREAGVRAVFVPGNHDWGNRVGPEGIGRLRNMETHLDGLAAAGVASVELRPSPGTPGPWVVDLRRRARILAIDGQWWLQSEDDRAEADAMRALAEALASAGDRRVVIASHLPLATGGPHGGTIPFFPTFGIRYLAHKSGLLGQDLTARPYRRFIDTMHDVFRSDGAPLAVAGGHDHSLQVLSVSLGEGGEYTQLVSGAGSKLTPIRRVDGMTWGRKAPGYMRLTFLTDGSVLLQVVAGAPRHLRCDEPARRATCMRAGVDSMRIVHGERLR